MPIHHASTPAVNTGERRRLLKLAASSGILAATPAEMLFAMARKPAVQGLHEVSGEVRVNGRIAAKGDSIVPGDLVESGPGARAVYVVGRSVFLQRDDSRVQLGELPESAQNKDENIVLHALRVLAGKLLSVHARDELEVQTAFGSIGIRGTGLYVDVQQNRTYACVCYGVADLTTSDGEPLETVRTRHHESPRYLYPAGVAARIEPAEVIDHTDDELILLESLVGREPPFVEDGVDRNY